MKQSVYSQNDLNQVASIFADSFSQKIAHIWIMTQNHEQASRIIAKSIKTDQLLVARDDEENIIGAATIETKEAPLAIDISHQLFIAEFGLVKGNVRYMAYQIYKNAQVNFNEEMLHLDLLAVDREKRGHGVGTNLLQQAEHYARAQGKNYVELEVVEGNDRAKKIYNRFGYEDIRRDNMNYFYSLFTKPGGFTSIYILRQDLS